MTHRRFDWHERIKEVEREYQATRAAVERLIKQSRADPNVLREAANTKVSDVRAAEQNLEGTYLVRLFAAFEAALKSYDRARRNDPDRDVTAAILIDSTASWRTVSDTVRDGAHDVRRVRNHWAHEDGQPVAAGPLSLNAARARLAKYLSWLPEHWD